MCCSGHWPRSGLGISPYPENRSRLGATQFVRIKPWVLKLVYVVTFEEMECCV